MDIDIQFKQTLQYDTLKELLEIITKSDLCKEARINTEHKPSCIDLIINEPNMRVRITSGYNRGINLSKLIRIYTKFDSRVIKLLRLFHKPELGTLHPIVYHIMVIHFLQQIDPPILPCLHEYVFGIDHVPVTMNENHYSEFFHICNEYSREWKSKNKTEIEMLFLQLLSYYVKIFHAKQFVVSIQTRMPVVKIDKNWHSKKLLVEDPSDIKRSLCQTMQAIRSINYFRDTLNTALNYFGRKQKRIKKIQSNQCSNDNNDDDDLIEIIAEDENEIPIIEPTNALHNSYNLFYKRLPLTIVRDVNTRQSRVRDYYKNIFEMKIPEPIIKLNSLVNQQYENLNENEIEEAFQHDLEHNFETMDTNDDEQNILLDRIISNNDNDYDENLNTDFDELNIENDINRKQSAVLTILFNINDLCPTNAPKRCPECKELYHIRKRCPKLISLANEKEKLKRVNIPEQQQQILINNQYESYPNISTNNSQYSLYPQYYYSTNGYQYPYQAIPHQRIWTQPYSNERPIIYPNFSYQLNQQQQQQTNNSKRLFYSNNQRRKCFICGSPNHIKAQCSQFQTNTLQR
ncbi:unnamed protein product [Rotaria sordida]|uniref:CCHC-type domain-containing protein n=1 Tax=Rotaria sordida TaxID=392033 RepID=A0A813TPU4_9BILA|nr:unnamed protein product [Rotaria sordida]